jgi:hypothetical protein
VSSIVPRFTRLVGGAKFVNGSVLRWIVPARATPPSRRSRPTFASTSSSIPAPLARCPTCAGRAGREACRSQCLQPTCSIFKQRAPVPRGAAPPDPIAGERDDPDGSRRPSHAGGSRPLDRGVFFPDRQSESEPAASRRPDTASSARSDRPSRSQARIVDPRVTGAFDADEPGHLPSTSSHEGIGRFDGLATAEGVTRCSSRRALARR